MNWTLIKNQKALLARERGAIVKDWGGKISIALVYPNTYQIGMSNLGVHKLYKLFNENKNVVCERAFLLDKKSLSEHKRTETPILSIETQRPLGDFNCLAFSLPFENDYLNIKTILELSQIPILKNDRHESMPLLIAGGAAVTINPIPLSKIFDAMAIGEGEDIIPKIIDVLINEPKKQKRVELLSRIEHIYVPIITKSVPNKASVTNLRAAISSTIVHTKDTEFGDMHLIEIQRGCPWNCKFCTTPVCYYPPRNFDLADIKAAIDEGIKYRKRFGLVGPDVLGHPKINEIVDYIQSLGATFSPASIRANRIVNNPKLIEAILKESNKTITLAPEAGTERLRFEIGKKIKDETFTKATQLLLEAGVKQIKLYFMIGLPNETEEDIIAIPRFARHLIGSTDKKFKLQLKINLFIPKPNTPFRNEKMVDEKYFKKSLKVINDEMRPLKSVGLEYESFKQSQLEYLLCNSKKDI